MVNNIPELQSIRKSSEYIYIALLILLGTLSFGLGRLSVSSEASIPPITLCNEAMTQQALLPAQAVSATTQNSTNQSGTYVASKNGSVYHLPWCSGAQRILEENKIWFNTKEDAEKAGYRPAGNCKGL